MALRLLTHTTTKLALVALLVPLLGCAAQGPPARPADFPLRATDARAFKLSWRLDREEGAVMAAGVVEVPAPERIADLTLELQGLGKDGSLVSRGFAHAAPRSFTGQEPWPFTIRLRPTGQEDRFALRVSDVTWRVMRGGR